MKNLPRSAPALKWVVPVTLLSLLFIGVKARRRPSLTSDPMAPVKGGTALMSERIPLRPALAFEANRGQWGPGAGFLARGKGYALALAPGHTDLRLRPVAPPASRAAAGSSPSAATVRMTLAGADSHPRMAGQDRLASYSNYFVGKDPSKWRTRVPHYGRVRYRQVYPGIDVVYYGHEGALEHDFFIAPGADPGLIRMRFEGAEAVRIDGGGDLVLSTPAGEARQKEPVLYQNYGGERRTVQGHYARRSNGEIGFEVGAYDRTRTLVIDPVLVYSTFIGGSGADYALATARDAQGNLYLCGRTEGDNYPTRNPVQPNLAGKQDVCLSKLNPDGTGLLFSTYFGGDGYDNAQGVAIEPDGSVLVAGTTDSNNFPLKNSYQPLHGGGTDGFVARFTPDGADLVYSTYLGGSGSDTFTDVRTDAQGNAYLAGIVLSANFPFKNPLLIQQAGDWNILVVKLDSQGKIVYATPFGGPGIDVGYGIAVDPQGQAYVVGYTEGSFPTKNALQPVYGGMRDAVVIKITASGTGLVYSTHLGGASIDEAEKIDVDSAGNAYVVGITLSPDFVVLNSFDTTRGNTACGTEDFDYPCYEGFLTKIKPDGSARVYSAFIGGKDGDMPNNVRVDTDGSVYVAGQTRSPDFPLVDPIQPALRGDWDGFLMKVDPTGTQLRYSTYFGDDAEEDVYGLSLAPGGTDVYLTGVTASRGFPTTFGSFQTAHAADEGKFDAFAVRIHDPNATPPVACGDANQDTQVDVSDAVRVLRYVVGQEPLDSGGLQAADADKSGGVDVADAVKILRIVTGVEGPC